MIQDIVDRIKARLRKNGDDLYSWKTAGNVKVETGYDSGEFVDVSLYMLKRALTSDNFTYLFSDWLNSGGKGFGAGVVMGLNLTSDHRTLQGLAVEYCLGILAGLAQQEHTDARNETAIATAKEILRLLDEGKLKNQRFI